MFTVKDLEKEDLLEVFDLPLEGGDLGLEFGDVVLLFVIVEIELVEVVDVEVISGSGIVVIMLSIPEGSDLVEVVGPMKLQKRNVNK